MIKDIFDIDESRFSPLALNAFRTALDIAKTYRSEFFTPEHLLLAITEQDRFRKFCEQNQKNCQGMSKELTDYILSLDRIPEDEDYSIVLSSRIKLMMNLCLNTINKGNKESDGFLLSYNVLDLISVMNLLDGTIAQYVIRKYLGESYSNWLLRLGNFYYDDEVVGEEVQENDFEDVDDFEDSEDRLNSVDMLIPHTEMGMEGGKSRVMARAFVNGKEIDLSSDELYKKLVASAGRLMSSLKPIVGNSGKTAGAEEPKVEKEPWEELVTCINDTYKQRNPLIGRRQELSRAIRILCRKDKNNPLFVGEPGVGKTALIYGLAQLIEENSDTIPSWLKGQKIYALDMTTMVAGASFHGEFEKRMKMVLDGAKNRGNCILYIDEIHSIIGTGGGNNSLNAADMLKPYLEDGSIRFIGTTTYQDYHKTIANNKSIARRFGQIDIKEPTVDETIAIITALLPIYENHHGVKYDDEAVRYSVVQSDSLIHDRFLPDKAIDIIDEAGAWLQQNPLLNKNGQPKQKRFQKVNVELVKTILTEVCRIDAKALTNENNIQLLDLDKRIANQIYGQDEAVRQVVRSVMMSKAGLSDPEKPLASLLFVGPTGVGKTEVCKVLAKELGVELVRFDMSEYTEKHTVSKLIGSPAGYVGYEEGGLLTDVIRKTPNCVLLLDEIEKAHSDIYNILLQVMDYARLTDNKGNKADFRNVILVMTSNAGAQYAGQAAIGFSGGQSKGQAMMQTVKKTFKPEFLNRLSGTVVFNDMDRTMASLILDKKLREVALRLEQKNVTLKLSDDVHEFLLNEGFTTKYGAREIDRVIQNHLMPILMDSILFGKLKKGGEALVSFDMSSSKMICN